MHSPLLIEREKNFSPALVIFVIDVSEDLNFETNLSKMGRRGHGGVRGGGAAAATPSGRNEQKHAWRCLGVNVRVHTTVKR
jgi:hypothetical protein